MNMPIIVSLAIVLTIIAIIIARKGRIAPLLELHYDHLLALFDWPDLPEKKDIKRVHLSTEEKKLLRSFSKEEWKEWDALLLAAKKIAGKYPFAMANVVDDLFPSTKSRKYYKKNIKRYTTCKAKSEVGLKSLSLEDLRLISNDTEEVWTEREKTQIAFSAIIKDYPQGYKTYCDIHKNNKPEALDVVRQKDNIRELQEVYDMYLRYSDWEGKQKKFSDHYWKSSKDNRPNDGRYVYKVSYQKPSQLGTVKDSSFTVWQMFSNGYSTHLAEKQTDDFKQGLTCVKELGEKKRYFYDSYYDKLLDFIKNKLVEDDDKILFLLIDNSSYHWDKDVYAYHYRHVISTLDAKGLLWAYYSNLGNFEDDGSINEIIALDVATPSEDLFRNCKLIIEHFSKSVPVLGYYSLYKEYSEEEMRKNKEYLREEPAKEPIKACPVEVVDNEEEDTKFIKHQMELVNKHDYFLYTAIPNSWIGEAEKANEIKSLWLYEPKRYSLILTKKAGYVTGEYSTDYGITLHEIKVAGDERDIDDVAKFTYILFKKMGVLEQFKKNGYRAVEYMNEKGLLQHH